MRAHRPSPARAPWRLLALLGLAAGMLFALASCGDEAGDDDHGQESGGDPVAGNALAGPEIRILGRSYPAGERDRVDGFLLTRSKDVWSLETLETRFANLFVHAMAFDRTGGGWIAAEGYDDPDSDPLASVFLEQTADGWMEVAFPASNVAVTRIVPATDEALWVVGARRIPEGLAGVAFRRDNGAWLEHSPAWPPHAASWNLSHADFLAPQTGAALAVVTDLSPEAGIHGDFFLFDQGTWLLVDLGLDPVLQTYMFTDLHMLGESDVLLAGRIDDSGLIASYHDDLGLQMEDLSGVDAVHSWWQLDTVLLLDDQRWAFGCTTGQDGLCEPLVLIDRGDGWTEADLPTVHRRPDNHEQARAGIFLSEELGWVILSEYYYGPGVTRDQDNLIRYRAGSWSVVDPLPLPVGDYTFQTIAVSPAP